MTDPCRKQVLERVMTLAVGVFSRKSDTVQCLLRKVVGGKDGREG